MVDLTSGIADTLERTTNKYVVELQFTEDILGGQSQTRELLTAHLEAMLRREAKEAEKQGIEPPSEERLQELLERHLERLFTDGVDDTIEAESERMHTTFFRDRHGPYIGVYQVKAMIREMMSCLGITMKKRGSKQTFQHLLAIRACDGDGNILEGEQGLRLHFFRDGDVVPEVDGHLEMSANVATPQGKRSILKRHDKIDNASIRFAWTLPANARQNRSTALLKDKEVQEIMAHAQNDGLGAVRPLSHGTFTVTRLERVTDNPWVE